MIQMPVQTGGGSDRVKVGSTTIEALPNRRAHLAAQVNIDVSSAPSVIDGQQVTQGQLIFTPYQTDTTERIVWFVSRVGTGSNGRWVPAPGWKTGQSLTPGIELRIVLGNVDNDVVFILVTDPPMISGSTPLLWNRHKAGYSSSGDGFVISDGKSGGQQVIGGTSDDEDLILRANTGSGGVVKVVGVFQMNDMVMRAPDNSVAFLFQERRWGLAVHDMINDRRFVLPFIPTWILVVSPILFGISLLVCVLISRYIIYNGFCL